MTRRQTLSNGSATATIYIKRGTVCSSWLFFEPQAERRASREGCGVYACLCIAPMSDIMSDMKIVTLRSVRRDAALLDRAASGEEILVTRFGKPYVRIIAANQARSFLGAGKHLRTKKPVSPDPIPVSEWKGLV